MRPLQISVRERMNLIENGQWMGFYTACRVITGMKYLKYLVIIFVVLIVMTSCATTSDSVNPSYSQSSRLTMSTNPQTAPLWVTDMERAFPGRDWLAVIEQGDNIRIVENAAVSRMGQIFRIDLRTVSSVNQQILDRTSSIGGRNIAEFIDQAEFSQFVEIASAVEGLVGLHVESWVNPRDSRVYAIARMNRSEGSARYLAIIQENEAIITRLIREAEQNQRTFEAVQMLNLAHNFATVTDNFQSILSVLNPSMIGRIASYGNAESVRTLSQNALRDIVITVNVSGDENSRILRTFTEVLNSKGFRTSGSGQNSYLLSVSFLLEQVETTHPRFVFVRYVLDYTLIDRNGVSIFSFSESGQEGHLNLAEARQFAIQIVAESITSDGFSHNFSEFLNNMN